MANKTVASMVYLVCLLSSESSLNLPPPNLPKTDVASFAEGKGGLITRIQSEERVIAEAHYALSASIDTYKVPLSMHAIVYSRTPSIIAHLNSETELVDFLTKNKGYGRIQVYNFEHGTDENHPFLTILMRDGTAKLLKDFASTGGNLAPDGKPEGIDEIVWEPSIFPMLVQDSASERIRHSLELLFQNRHLNRF